MIYEVRARFFFEDENQATDFMDDCRKALSNATVVNPGEPNQECSTADLVLCHHDDHPPYECLLNEGINNCP